MATYFGEAFEKDDLVHCIKGLFDLGVESYVPQTDLAQARISCARELFYHIMDWNVPNLDEVRSEGPVQDYLKILKERKLI